MERLTKHSKQTSHENGICCTHFRGPECLEVGGNCAMNCKWEEAAWSRLAAYEDTGLTPERCAEFARADAEGRYIVMRDAEQEGVARLRELAEADKAGRLVVLPSNKALTNADRMRTATNQQLAKQLYDTQKELCRMLYKKLGFEDELNFSEDYSDILAWLNAPSKEAEKELEAMKDA
jgi:hypothetical protein